MDQVWDTSERYKPEEEKVRQTRTLIKVYYLNLSAWVQSLLPKSLQSCFLQAPRLLKRLYETINPSSFPFGIC